MTPTYDICVDYDTLLDVGSKLQKIGRSLYDSTAKMETALQYSQDFLEGYQFERVKQNTRQCLQVAKRTENNLHNAMEYIKALMQILEEYQKCGYNGGKA